MSIIPEEARRDHDADWQPNRPPAPSTSPSRAAAAMAAPQLLRALEPYVNQAATDLSRMGPSAARPEGSLLLAKGAEADDHRVLHSNSALQRFTAALELAPYGSGETEPDVLRSAHSTGAHHFEASWPRGMADRLNSTSRASLTEAPLGDPRALEGRSDGLSGLDGAAAQTIAELTTRLLQAVTRLEQIAERRVSEAPRSYRSTPPSFRDRIEG